MKFIVDECTGIAVAEHLRAGGHDVMVVAETMTQAEDHTILNKAVDEKRILITNDKDFGELIFRRGFSYHGVLLLRLQDDSSANRVRVVKAVLEQYGDLLKTSFLVASETRVRIRYSTVIAGTSHKI
jgi:predicted nuclease of predicted toxin-antitoxin system